MPWRYCGQIRKRPEQLYYGSFAALRGFARFLSSHGYNCSGILTASLPTPERIPPQSIPDDIVDLIAEPAADSWIARRNSSIVHVLLETGATVSEVVALDCSEVFWEVGGVALAIGCSAARLATLSDQTLVAIKLYRECSPFDHSQEGPLFLNRNGIRLTARSVQMMLAKRTTELGIPGASAMMLRHRVGHMLAERGHSLEVVAQRLGLSVTTATKYFSLPRYRTALPDKQKRSQRGRQPLIPRRTSP